MKLWLVGLAASAAWVSMAAAQTVPDPDPAYGLPQIGLKLPAAAASSVAPAAPAPAAVRTAPVVAPVQLPPVVRVRPPPVPHAAPPPQHVEMHRQALPVPAPIPAPPAQVRREVMSHPPMQAMGAHGHHAGMQRHPGMGPGQHHGPRPGWTRIRRGGVVPGFWTGRQFVVRNWGMYGFPQPFAGGRWIRYYDDALLVDRYGRVHDGRYGYDWDRYGDRWSYRDGIPAYADDGDDEEWDRDWDEGFDEEGEDMVYDRGGPPPPDCRDRCSAPYPAPPPDYGYGYGVYYAPVVVTETITTTGPVGDSEIDCDDSPAKVRHYRRKVVRRALPHRPPPPYDGERG